MSADRLRAAAETIRTYANDADAFPRWDYDQFTALNLDGPEALHIALWSPPVALAVADWLDLLADENGDFLNRDHAAMRLADFILGDTP